jgi:hypothetical protein
MRNLPSTSYDPLMLVTYAQVRDVEHVLGSR